MVRWQQTTVFGPHSALTAHIQLGGIGPSWPDCCLSGRHTSRAQPIHGAADTVAVHRLTAFAQLGRQAEAAVDRLAVGRREGSVPASLAQAGQARLLLGEDLLAVPVQLSVHRAGGQGGPLLVAFELGGTAGLGALVLGGAPA